MALNLTEDPDRASGWFSFRAYGHIIACNRPVPGWLPQASGSPDLVLNFSASPPVDWQPAEHQPAFLGQLKSRAGLSLLSLYRLEACLVMRFLDQADFYLWPDRVVCCSQPELPAYALNTLLFANALPVWLELKGFTTFHASAVSLSGHAIAFVGHSLRGKSTLAASMIQQGCSLLTDDVLPVNLQDAGYIAYPGFPAMRMWPDETEHFFARVDDLEKVHPEYSKRYVPLAEMDRGAFSDLPCQLKRIYILERREASDLPDGPLVEGVSTRDAVIELLRYTFVARLAEAAGLAPNRFQFLTRLVQKIPLSRLVYPSGYEYLPQTRQVILADSSTPLT